MSTSNSNGVIRIGRKGLKRFAFGDDGAPFEVDVVVAFQQWITIDDAHRPPEDMEGNRSIAPSDMPAYHCAAQSFVAECGGGPVTVAEALDFIARLREQYDELAAFFRPRSRDEHDSPDTSAVPSAIQFSEEPVLPN